MDLSAEMRRQALRHGVADAIAGITRLQIEDDVYDADYWRDYRAGLSKWQAAGQRPELAEDRKPQAPRADQVARGSAHCDPGLAAREWRERRGLYICRGREQEAMSDGEQSAAGARAASEATGLLEQLRRAAESARGRGKTILAEHQASVMRVLEGSWALDIDGDSGVPDTEPGA